jgi:hypothetical protein
MDNEKYAARAKMALEHVCSGLGLEPAARYYSPTFVDYVNDMQFRGLAGAEQSVNLYKKVLSNLRITVKEQTVQGDRVTSRFMVTGTSYGRSVCFNGITMSRFEKDLIVEDWSLTDTLGMLRQLGWWRTLILGLRSWRELSACKSFCRVP